MTSDHLPPLDGGTASLQKLGYTLTASDEYKQNIWFYDGPQRKNLAWPDYYYEFMDFLLDVLTEERICQAGGMQKPRDLDLGKNYGQL